MITLHVIVSNTTTVKVITEGVRNRPQIDYVICERFLTFKSLDALKHIFQSDVILIDNEGSLLI